jgi:hypothetical protein
MGVIKDALTALALQAGIGGEAKISIPSDDAPSPSAGHIIGFIFFAFLFLICAFGVAVEYTNLFETFPKPEHYEELDDGAKDKELLKSKSKLGKAFLSFSFSRNLRKLFWTPQKDTDYLTVLNGIRVISMAYIIFGHCHEVIAAMPVTNILTAGELVTEFYTNIVAGGFYSVDVFFFFSAFLGAYLMISKFNGKK